VRDSFVWLADQTEWLKWAAQSSTEGGRCRLFLHAPSIRLYRTPNKVLLVKILLKESNYLSRKLANEETSQ